MNNEDKDLIVGILKAGFHRATLSKAQKALYARMEDSMIYDSAHQRVTYIIPKDVSKRDLKRVQRQMDLDGGEGKCWPHFFINEGDPLPPGRQPSKGPGI